MSIQLGSITQTKNGYSTQLDKIITIEEFENFFKAIDELHNYENLKRLYEIVILNNNELILFIESEKESLFEDSLSLVGDKEKYYKHHLNLNRIMLNYLASFRMLVDHIETIIKRKFGKKSQQAKLFKQLTNKIFDKYFAYRFFYKLRNYSQHCGIPIDDFEISATALGSDKFKPEYKIEFSSKELLSNYKEWGAILNNDLKSKDKFSLFPLLEQMKNALDELWKSMISIFENKILESIDYIEKNSGYLKTPENSVCIFSNIKNDGNGQMRYFTNNIIPFDIIEELRIKTATNNV